MLTAKRQILISAPKESVRKYLRDLSRFSEYGPKLSDVAVSQSDDAGGVVDVQGHFMALPWHGSFKVEFAQDGGYRREMVRGPLPKMVGGFHLRSVTGGTLITQEQQCQLPLPLRPLSFLWRRWLDSAMDRELHVIKEGAERLNRELQLKQLENSAI